MDEKMEIRLVNPTEDGFLQKIDWNKAELEANVRSIVEAYRGLVYTEDTVSDAKNDRAALRKLLNEIEDRRKHVKKKCMEPYEVFESDLKDVTVLIKEQISIIDGQVKEYENSVKEEKKARLQDVYTEAIGELAEVLPFERVFEAQYLNVSFKESKASTEIQEKIQRVKSDLAAIDALDSKASASASSYTTMLCFSRANSIYDEYGVNMGCNLIGNWYTLKNFKIGSISAGGYTAFSGAIPIVCEITNNGNSWTYSHLRVYNGIIVGYWN